MTLWLLSGSLGFASGFAICWFYRNKVEAAVVATNAAVAGAKTTVSNVVTDIKKL